MVPTARIGGEDGARLSRAAFAVILKFSNNLDAFLRLLEDVSKQGKEIGDSESVDQKVKSITKLMRD